MAGGGLGTSEDYYHTVNFREATGEQKVVDATSSLAIFVAPVACQITEIELAVTTAITANSSNHWTIAIVNQTGDNNLLSDNFDTDSDNSGNGGRDISGDTVTSLTDDGVGTNYLTGNEKNILAKGDIIVLTATKAASADDLDNPTITVHYRTD